MTLQNKWPPKKGGIIIHFEPFVHQKPKVRFQAWARFIFICTLPISQNHCLFCFAPILFVLFCLFCFVHHWKGKSHFKLHHTNVLFYSLSFGCFYFAMFTQKSASSCLIFIKITKVTLMSISNLLSLNVLLSFDSLLLYNHFDFNNKDIFLYFV